MSFIQKKASQKPSALARPSFDPQKLKKRWILLMSQFLYDSSVDVSQ